MPNTAHETTEQCHIKQIDEELKPQNTLRVPNLFIVGASKSGSTALWYLLKQHSNIFLPKEELKKEPCFFSPSGNLGNYDLKRYLDLYKNAKPEQTYLGDASTAYLTDPESAKLIHACSPDAKIIIILRNPVQRAYSLYNWMCQEGYEWAPTFEKGLQLENWRKKKSFPSLMHPNYRANYLYFESGCYGKQVKRYIDLFGENVLILKFRDLKQQPEDTLGKIYNFLGVKGEELQNEILNPSYRVRSPKLQYILRYATTTKLAIEKRLGKNTLKGSKNKRDKLLKLGIKKEKPEKINPTTYQNLVNAYKKDITYLQNITGIDFSFWLNPTIEKAPSK